MRQNCARFNFPAEFLRFLAFLTFAHTFCDAPIDLIFLRLF